MPRTLFVALVIILLFSLLAGCAPSNLALHPDFWQTKGRKIGVAVATPPMAGAHRTGGEGLLDMAINKAATNSLESHLQKIDSSGFEDIADRFVEGLKRKGFTVKKLEKPIAPAKLAAFSPKTSGRFHERDLSFLVADEDLDALVLLSIDRWGTIRKYYGFIPLESPSGFCAGKGQLIDLRSNALEWSYVTPEGEGSVEVEGSWDKPPYFPGVTAALRKAVNRAKQTVESDFFDLTSPPASTSERVRYAPQGIYNRSSVSFSIGYGFFSPNDELRADWANISIIGTDVRVDEGNFGGLGVEARVLFWTPLLDSRLRLGGEYSLQILASEPTGGTIEYTYAGLPIGSSAAEKEFLGHSIQVIGDFKIGSLSTVDVYGSIGLGVLFFSGEKARSITAPSPTGTYQTYYFPETRTSLPMEMAGSARLYGSIPITGTVTLDPALRFFQSFGNEKAYLTQMSLGIAYVW